MISTEAPKHYVRALTSGWRFTLPAHIRKKHGFREGTLLKLYPSGSVLVIEGADPAGDGKKHPEEGPWATAYLGAGGKVVIPSEIREVLGWSIGERLSIADDERGAKVTTCCPRHRCRSCGRLTGVREIIPNLYLCEECLKTYSLKIKARRSSITGSPCA